MKMNPIVEILLSSVIAAFLALILASVVLPQFLVILTPQFNSLQITSSGLLITYFGLLVILIASFGMCLIFAGMYPFKSMLAIMFMAGILSLVLVMVISYLVLAIKFPEVFTDIPNITRFVSLYQYPSLLVLKEQSPSLVWDISLVIYLVFFNAAFVYLSKKGEKKQ